MEAACKHVHTKIFTHMRGDVSSKPLSLNVCKVLSKIPLLLGDGRADLCCGRWRWERLALFGRGSLPSISVLISTGVKMIGNIAGVRPKEKCLAIHC